MDDKEELEIEFVFSPKITKKLKEKHNVTTQEVEQCFFNSGSDAIEDKRAKNSSSHPTLCFIAQTNAGRELKVCFVFVPPNKVFIKTGYDPSEVEQAIFSKKCK